jgi:hypothetical protein
MYMSNSARRRDMDVVHVHDNCVYWAEIHIFPFVSIKKLADLASSEVQNACKFSSPGEVSGACA